MKDFISGTIANMAGIGISIWGSYRYLDYLEIGTLTKKSQEIQPINQTVTAIIKNGIPILLYFISIVNLL